MPTTDDPAPPPRRSLGRGPGTPSAAPRRTPERSTSAGAHARADTAPGAEREVSHEPEPEPVPPDPVAEASETRDGTEPGVPPPPTPAPRRMPHPEPSAAEPQDRAEPGVAPTTSRYPPAPSRRPVTEPEPSAAAGSAAEAAEAAEAPEAVVGARTGVPATQERPARRLGGGDADAGDGKPVDGGGRMAPEPPGAGRRPAEAPVPPEPGESADGAERAEGGGGGFQVRLDNFEGPFDLLLQLIAKHKLDVTEVALSKVTDEFIAYIRAMGPDWDLDQATEFLVVAATLLDLKAARLLPSAEVEDEEDLALLEARDLLFARLLQYRAYKQIAAIFALRWAEELRHHPRTVGLEPHHADLLPEVVISIGPEGFARLAAKAMVPKPRPTVYVEHIHAPLVSVREQAEIVVALLRRLGTTDFRTLTEDAPDTLTVVARFLALLELYREKAVVLDQDEALGELLVRWTGTGDEESGPLVTDEFDQENASGGERKGRGRR